jgi:hypothetical protein
LGSCPGEADPPQHPGNGKALGGIKTGLDFRSIGAGTDVALRDLDAGERDAIASN